MASVKSRDCVAGFELTGDRIRIAAITGTDADSRAGRPRQLYCEEIVIPQAEADSPASLPSASSLVPLFKATLARLGIGAGRAAVAIGGSRLILRYFVGSDDMVRTELQQAAERSISYVQFGSGDRLVGERLYRMADGRAHALLGVSAATAIDPLAKALEQVGLRVKVIEPGLVALARMAAVTGQLDGKAALLVLVNADGIDIGVVSEGHVLFSRRPLSAAGREPESEAVRPPCSLPTELERMSRHYMRAFGASEQVRHIVMCGSETLVRPFAEALGNSSEFQTDLLRIDDTVATALAIPPGDLETSPAHAVALGAAAGLAGVCGEVVGPNLTSEPEIRHRPLLETLVRALFWPTLAALGIWGAVYFAEQQLESTLAKLRIEAEHPSAVETAHRELQMQLVQTEQRAARISELVQNFPDRRWRGLLETIRSCVPDRLWLTQIRLTSEQNLTVEGAAYDESLVYQFRKDLEGAPLFESATIVATASGEQDNAVVTEFSLECTLVSSQAPPQASDS